ncbi:replication factor C subunit 3 [Amazona aestiva]|uniref:Replication factor C subunit 3 n=1 Tax=Amazona aestiva TaxID=12930 RepID=A0A0Q3P0B0_AMAAE|nr:replication factor C subunit 3 [Amazona aestiva]
MSLWVDKHRPASLGRLDYHREQAAQLRNLVQCGDFPHLLVYGPSGAGKKTRIMCLLRELYGAGVEKLRIEHQSITAPSKKKIEISTIASNYHLEVNPRAVLLSPKEYAVRIPKHCLLVTGLAWICHVLSTVCKKEGLTLPQELAQRLAEKSGRNLRKALLMCESCRVQQYPFTADQDIPEMDWEVYLRETANAVVSQQTPQRMSQEQSGMEKWDNDLGSLKEEMVIIAPESQHFPLLILLLPLSSVA